jgi:hypothetical protein
LDLGEASLLNFFVVAFDASNVFRQDGSPRGVLSAKAFSGYLLTLNYPKKRMELRVGELPPADNTEILDFDASTRLPDVPVRVAGVDLHANLDSGSSYGLVVPAKYAGELPLNGKLLPFPKIHRVDMESEVQHAKLKGVMQLGRYTFSNPDVIFDKSLQTANVGTGILQRSRVTLDSKNHRIQLQEIPADESD